MTPVPDAAVDRTSARAWSSRSTGSRLGRRIFRLLIRFPGPWAAYGLLAFVALWYTLGRPAMRRRALPYLTRRFPASGGPARLLQGYRLNLAFGKVIVGRAVLQHVGPRPLTVRLHNRQELLDLVAEGRGVVLIGAHVGGWQVAMSALESLRAPVHLLIHREAGDIDMPLGPAGTAEPARFQIIDPGGAFGGTVEMLTALRRGELVCTMGDRVLGSPTNTVSVPFLGAAARFPYSAYRVASVAGAPVAVLLSCQTGLTRYELTLAAVIRLPPGLGRGSEPYRPFVARFVQVLEAYVAEHPFQFFDFYDLWEAGVTGPPGRAAAAGPGVRAAAP